MLRKKNGRTRKGKQTCVLTWGIYSPWLQTVFALLPEVFSLKRLFVLLTNLRCETQGTKGEGTKSRICIYSSNTVLHILNQIIRSQVCVSIFPSKNSGPWIWYLFRSGKPEHSRQLSRQAQCQQQWGQHIYPFTAALGLASRSKPLQAVQSFMLRMPATLYATVS